MAHLFHFGRKAQDRFEQVQRHVRFCGPPPQWSPLYETPAPPSNEVGKGRRPAELELGERPALVGDREETEHTILIGYGLAERDEAPMHPRRPLELPDEDHAAAVVPDAV